MKKLVVVSLLSLSASATYAQSIPAGTISLGGSIGYTTSSSESGTGSNTFEGSSSQFSIAPALGYFVADNLALGLNLEFRAAKPFHSTSSGQGQNIPEVDASTSLRVGPFVQYYKMLGEQFGFTGNLGAGYQSINEPRSINSSQRSDFKASGYYAGLTPGFVFFPIPKFGISASMGALAYTRLSFKPDNVPADFKSISSSFTANFGLSQLQLGGTFYFGR